jgi:polyphosphate kinase
MSYLRNQKLAKNIWSKNAHSNVFGARPCCFLVRFYGLAKIMSESLFLPTPHSLLAKPDQPFIHRDASWLQFNERVLYEARANSNPLVERLKFLSITSRNLDEFFMVRYASLLKKSKVENQTFKDSLLGIVSTFGALQAETLDFLVTEFDSFGLKIVINCRSDERFLALGRKIFMEKIFPNLGAPETLSQSAINKLQNLQKAILGPGGLGWRVSTSLPGVFLEKTEHGHYLFFLDDLIINFLSESFRIKGSVGVLRLTRDSDNSIESIEDDPQFIPEMVRANIKSRDHGPVVRVQTVGEISQYWLKQITKFAKVSNIQIQASPTSLCLGSLWTVTGVLSSEFGDNAKMCYAPTSAKIPERLNLNRYSSGEIFESISKQDILLHHPYDSFDAFVNFIRAACEDPFVTEIGQTVYRIDAVSPVVDLLKKAASNSVSPKKVKVVIELRARFDELNNLALAENLRSSGVEVAFGFGKLKVHAKMAYVVRTDPVSKKAVVYTHLSTGNYNAQTARIYEDFALITARPQIASDALYFFKSVFDGQIPRSLKSLITAPMQLHKKLLSLIEAETAAALRGEKAQIRAKVNALVDHGLISQLYQASKAGVKIELVVRGACSLIPGVRGLSENIKVYSIVDRYLEHSRIYYFENSGKLYLSSADWMPRNFYSRLEIAFPVEDPELFKFLKDVVLPAYLVDTVRGRELTAQGTWKRRTLSALSSAQKKVTSELSQMLTGKNAIKPGPAAIRAQFFFESLNNQSASSVE